MLLEAEIELARQDKKDLEEKVAALNRLLHLKQTQPNPSTMIMFFFKKKKQMHGDHDARGG